MMSYTKASGLKKRSKGELMRGGGGVYGHVYGVISDKQYLHVIAFSSVVRLRASVFSTSLLNS